MSASIRLTLRRASPKPITLTAPIRARASTPTTSASRQSASSPMMSSWPQEPILAVSSRASIRMPILHHTVISPATWLSRASARFPLTARAGMRRARLSRPQCRADHRRSPWPRCAPSPLSNWPTFVPSRRMPADSSRPAFHRRRRLQLLPGYRLLSWRAYLRSHATTLSPRLPRLSASFRLPKPRLRAIRKPLILATTVRASRRRRHTSNSPAIR